MRYLEDIARTPVFTDSDKVGNVFELVFDDIAPYPKVVAIGIKFDEVDSICGYPLFEAAEDLVPALPWGEIIEFGTEKVVIEPGWAMRPLFDFKAAGLLLARGDLLDTQIVDRHGHKIQRVDDIVLGKSNGDIFLIGLQTGMGGMIKRFDLDDQQDGLAKRFSLEQPERLIPWPAVKAYDRAQDIVLLNIGIED